MNSIKKIAFFALTAALFVSCKDKKENMDTPGTTADTTMTDATAANVETATFKIDGMTCPMGCAATIQNKLAALEGVQDAKVDFENKTATVSYDVAKQTPETLVSTVEGIANGAYKVSDVHSSADKAYYAVDQEKEKTKKTEKKDSKSCCSSGDKKEGKSCCGSTSKKCSSETKKATTM